MIAQIKQQVTTQRLTFLTVITGLALIIIGLFFLGHSYKETLFKNTYINDVDLSNKSINESIELLQKQNFQLNEHTLILKKDDITLASHSAQLGYQLDFRQAVETVFAQQHQGNYTLKALLAYFNKDKTQAPKTYNQNKLENFLNLFKQKIELVGENPQVELKISNLKQALVVNPGKPGRELDKTSTQEDILKQLQTNNYQVEAKVASTSAVLDEKQIQATIQRASKFVGKKLTIIAEDKKFFLTDKQLVSFVNPLGGYQEELITQQIEAWAKEVNSQPQDAVFKYNKETLEVEKFVPHKDGLEVDVKASLQTIINYLNSDLKAESLELTLKKTKPKTTLETTNDLGIKERIGFGESYYYHSIPNRIHNVDITAKRISLKIIPPGEEFSFNKTLGEVSAKTGYKSAYVIQGGKTVLGDGGGVCQVSSTLFRAVLDAGLDVTKRLQHSYRVSYYELNSQPGFDATVYSGEVDFRFINDTPNHILILTSNDPEKLYLKIEIYGTNDGRTSEIHDYKKWALVAPPKSEYYPTPDLPHGKVKQIDWAVSGIKTQFTNTVKDKNGEIIHQDTYYSNYRPWAAKYLIGI